MPRRVVVIGASMSGVLAAAACAGPGRSVMLLERDEAPPTDAAGEPLPRPGVPQSSQPHVFLHRGLLAAETLLPGLRDDLLRRGGEPFDSGMLPWRSEHGWLVLRPFGIELVSATRPLLDDVVRARVLALPGVDLRWGVRVDGVEHVPPGQPGARWRVRAGGEAIEADLVVDASGRGSRLPVWLHALGVREARVEEIDARMGYATGVYAGGREILDAPGVAILATPANPVGAMALLTENRRWMVTAAGFGDRRPPRDAEGYEAFLRALPDPAFADLISRADPLGEVAVYRQTGNRRRHYERVPAWPDGLVVVGDSFCTFDPIYGQGITVAALEAVLLREAIRSGDVDAGMDPGWSARLLRRFARVVDLPWAVATGEDRRFLPGGNQQTRVQRVLGAWTGRLDRMAAHGDPFARLQLTRAYNLLGSPAALIHPRLVVAAARNALFGEGEPCPRPASLDALGRAATAADG